MMHIKIDTEHSTLRMPALGLGTYKQKGSLCRRAVCDALSMGYRHIDTARFYDNEVQVGAGMEDAGVARDEIFLATKVWRTELSAEALRRSVEGSLRDLKTDYVDLLMIHWPSPDVPLEATLDAMTALQREGKARHLGVSNFPVAHVERARRHATIVCNQVEYHPFLSQQTLLAAQRPHDIALVAYAPLARGRVWEDPVLQAIGRELGKTAGQVALRWFVQQALVGAVPKATSREHIAENFAVFDFELSERHMDMIAGVERGQRLVSPDFAPDWD